MDDLTPIEVAESNSNRKKRKFPAGRSLFVVGAVVALGFLSWLGWINNAAMILICFLYTVYLLTESTEELFDQVAMLRYENAVLRQRVTALAEQLLEARGGNDDHIA